MAINEKGNGMNKYTQWQRFVIWIIEFCWSHEISLDYSRCRIWLWGHKDGKNGYVTEKLPCILCPIKYISSACVHDYVQMLPIDYDALETK